MMSELGKKVDKIRDRPVVTEVNSPQKAAPSPQVL